MRVGLLKKDGEEEEEEGDISFPFFHRTASLLGISKSRYAKTFFLTMEICVVPLITLPL